MVASGVLDPLDAPLEPGAIVAGYRIERLLGLGGMGAVYEAEHPMIRRKVAVKVLRRELALDRGLVQRFFNEARAANSIRHPNIVEVIDLGTLPDGVPRAGRAG